MQKKEGDKNHNKTALSESHGRVTGRGDAVGGGSEKEKNL